MAVRFGAKNQREKGRKGRVKLRGDAVGVAELQIGAPFGALDRRRP